MGKRIIRMNIEELNEEDFTSEAFNEYLKTLNTEELNKIVLYLINKNISNVAANRVLESMNENLMDSDKYNIRIKSRNDKIILCGFIFIFILSLILTYVAEDLYSMIEELSFSSFNAILVIIALISFDQISNFFINKRSNVDGS